MARSRSINSALARLLGASPSPVYLLDAGRTIVYCNAACAKWAGLELDELVGTRCDYHSSEDTTTELAVAAGLCPPPEVFRGDQTSAEVACRQASGKVSRRRAQFIPLSAGGDEIAGVIAVVAEHDISSDDVARGESADGDAQRLHEKLLGFRGEIRAHLRVDRLVGESPAIRRVRKQVQAAIETPTRVVISGPPGSGRQHLAKAIHYGRQIDKAPRLVPLDCALVDAEILQATIRSVKGGPDAWLSQRPATLLLLDVDQLSDAAQYELAGFLTMPTFDLNTIATSRTVLLPLVERGAMRPELAYGLSTLVVELPALVSRPEDVPLLAQFFLEQENAKGRAQLSGFTEDALDHLAMYDWPRDVEELAESVAAAFQRADGPLIASSDLPEQIHLAASAARYPRKPDEEIVLDEFLAEIERELIERALSRAKGNKSKAAELLGINRARLLRRVAQADGDDPR